MVFDEEIPQTWDESYDLVVVGSGFAGVCAAIEGLKAGCSLLLVEKMSTAGGNSIIDSGELSVVDSPQQKKRHVRDSASLLAQDMLVNGEFLNNPEKVRYIAEHAHDVYEWTQSLGVKWREGVARAGGHSVARVIVTHTGSGREIYECLYEHYKSLGGTVNLNTYVEKIIRGGPDGRVLGVRIRQGYKFPDAGSGVVRNIRASKAVILCHGGFAADAEYRHQKAPEIPTDISTTNQPGATGELWREAERIGCMILQAGWVQCTPWNNPKEQGQGIGWIFSEYAAASYGLWVNQLGERFVNEAANRKVRTHAIFDERHKHRDVFCIANEECTSAIEKMRPGYMKSVVDMGLVGRYETIEEMERALGIPQGALAAQIAEFNEMIGMRRDRKFGRPINKIKPLASGPWYAAQMTPRVHHCMGGIMTDPQGRALDAATQKVIKGLFAAGEAAGGVHGACRIGACAILDCLVMGRLAGMCASEESEG